MAASNQPVSQVACAMRTVLPAPGPSCACKAATGIVSMVPAARAIAKIRDNDGLVMSVLLVFFLRTRLSREHENRAKDAIGAGSACPFGFRRLSLRSQRK